ncbi:MAG: glycoside hydrolase family protein [Comamonas sp.]|nr:glycoside hydrolase family protein [Comamonas sp.]
MALTPTSRIGLAALALSATGLVYIAQREGYRADAYPDPVHGAAVPTIGYGSTGGVKMGDKTTPDRALLRLAADARAAEVALKRCLPAVPLHPWEWDAFVGLAYNTGVTTVCKNNARTGPSTLAARLAAQDYAGACNAILLYDRAGPVNKPSDRCSHPDNRTCRGVWKDRLALQAMCLGQRP